VAPLKRVVVGVDGSAGSTHALEWAAAEADRSGALLEVHTVYSPGYVFVTSEEVQAIMQEVIDDAAARVAALAPGVEVKGVTHEGATAKILIEASRGADLLIVGSRGLGGFSGLLLGSVSQQCSHHAHCPVLIVRPVDAQS
jgi:nucleotide-binding universal stress UspA family protein